MSVTTDQRIRSYTAGSWTIAPIHSEVGFSVRHLMVSCARGKFTEFSGQIVTGARRAASWSPTASTSTSRSKRCCRSEAAGRPGAP